MLPLPVKDMKNRHFGDLATFMVIFGRTTRSGRGGTSGEGIIS